MKITILRRGDKDYVYLYTSRRIKGRKNPAVIKRYVGILDGETGLVTPKKVPPETFLAQIHDGEFTCHDLGSILVARKVAEALGIPGYLEDVFGEDSKVVYTLVLAIAANPLHSSDYLGYACKYYLGDIIGKRALTAKDIDRALGDFQSRMPGIYADSRNVRERLVFLIDPAGPCSGRPGMMPGRMLFVITDGDGNPLFLRSSAAGRSMSESLRAAVSHANASGGSNTFVLGSPVSTETMVAMVSDGVRFIMNADTMLDDGDVFDRISEEFADDWSVTELDSVKYHVLEIGMGILREGGGMRAVFGRPGQLRNATIVLRAVVWYDQEEYERHMRDLSLVTRRRVEALRNMGIDSAREHLSDGSPESRFISVHENEDGSVGVRVHRKVRRQIALRSSVHMFVSDQVSWEEGMHCIGIRRDVLSHTGPIAQVAVDRRERSGYSYMFLAFAAMTIRMNLERTVREKGLDYASADEVFQTASSYTVVDVNGYLYRSAMTREAEALFEALEIDTGASDAESRQGLESDE